MSTQDREFKFLQRDFAARTTGFRAQLSKKCDSLHTKLVGLAQGNAASRVKIPGQNRHFRWGRIK